MTMLKRRRQQLHATIAKVFVEQFPALAESQPEIVANHYVQAVLSGEAIDHWVKAARLVHAQWANQESASFFEQALTALDTLPETQETSEQAIDLRFDLHKSLTPLDAFERTVGVLREAEGRSRRLNDRCRLCQASLHMCRFLNLGGNSRDAWH